METTRQTDRTQRCLMPLHFGAGVMKYCSGKSDQKNQVALFSPIPIRIR